MPMTSKEMVRLLEANGFAVVHQQGSHLKLNKANGNITVVVPMHCKDLGKGLEQLILKQARLK